MGQFLPGDSIILNPALTNYDVSSFIRDYLSIKLQMTPSMNKVYVEFKKFMDNDPFDTKEELLEELVSYARRYEQLIMAKTKFSRVNSCIDRLNKFEATVTRPFLLEVLRLSEDTVDCKASISDDDLARIFELTESYIFRRQICDIPTNALNKLFVALNKEILRYDGTADNYLEKFKYSLKKKTASGIYPTDAMFVEAISKKPIYLMRSKNKKYILERYENWGTVEVKDVWELIDEGKYTIEHIMPQTLSTEWKEELGPDYENIHNEWVHKLANLTLTAYNSKFSNSSFKKKRDMKDGFEKSGLRMNVNLIKYDKWTLDEMQNRNDEMVNKALSIWPMVTTDYKPNVDIIDTVLLSEDYPLKGKKIIKFLFKGMEEVTNSWVDMYISVVSKLHEEDPTKLYGLAIDKTESYFNQYFNESDDGSRYAVKIDDGIYVWINTSTETKISLLRRLFTIFGVDEDELTFYLRDGNSQKDDFKTPRHAIRYKFWEFALPLLRERTGRYQNVNPSTSNWQATYIGISGAGISSIANLNELRVEVYISTSNTNLNTMIFEHLYSKKKEIESNAGYEFVWTNIEDYNSKKIGIVTTDLGINNEDNWEQCAEFLINGVNCIAEFIVPDLVNFYESQI